jgi:SAM-dependent methyltransferase
MSFRAISNVLHLTCSQGVLKTFKSLRNRLAEKYLDYRFGIRTSEIRTKEQLGLRRDDDRYYVPTDIRGFRKLINSIDIRPGVDVFVDFGAGMGRVLILAALYPFRQIVGVEISIELCKIAQRNVDNARGTLLCKDVSIVMSDATDYLVPSNATLFYFFNPFTGAVLDTVLENIRRSLHEAPRQVMLLCNSYSSEAQFVQQICRCTWLVLLKTVDFGEAQVGLIFTNR